MAIPTTTQPTIQAKSAMKPSTLLSNCAYVALALACSPAMGQNTAQVQGTVTEDNGQSVPGAMVALHKAPRFAARQPGTPGASRTRQDRAPGDVDVNLTTDTGAKGAFAFSGL